MAWHFWIDVGGTFTDCVARSPAGKRSTAKVLSSGVTKGSAGAWRNDCSFKDAARIGDPADFWVGYQLRLVDRQGQVVRSGVVTKFDSITGELTVGGWGLAQGSPTWPAPRTPAQPYELFGGDEAPLLAIRRILGLRLCDPFPACDVRLGTTRGTNALLERKGAPVVLVTTSGFSDVLRIANQDRPRLFDLAIQKPQPLYETVVEVDERMTAEGEVLCPIDLATIRDRLQAVRRSGIESLAVCLLHAWKNPAHELLVGDVARDIGFTEISLSHQVSPRIKIVPRGDTTVLDAYLNPVLRDYVRRLQSALGSNCRLRLMTSAGGLIAAEHFTGRDSILSGPAGGVIGFSRAAELAGFPRAIGFDMGGTSTDVARFDGSYEYEYETVKAGVRVATPLLSIETVAAGGGSICGFDGVQLFVGPESAGADPGPACYGRGGPLTVTDVNLALGKLLPDEFPFPLDRAVGARRLLELCEAVAASPLGRRYSPHELAAGFVDLANANMIRAIRKVSIARGYDPADYTLVTFGGAGGQHACAIADELGVQSILVHPLAGVLSAWGIGLADVRRQAERPVLEPLTSDTLGQIEPTFQALETELQQAVESEGIAPGSIAPARRSLDLRYQGVESTLTIPEPHNRDYSSAYITRHEEVYGYRHADRPIEVAALRVEVVGRTPDPEATRRPQTSRHPSPCRTQHVWSNGGNVEAGVYQRDDLRPGDFIAGPAIINEVTSTLFVDPAWTAKLTELGDLLLCRRHESDDGERSEGSRSCRPVTDELHGGDDRVDLITLEVFNNQFASIAEQMGLTLQRTSVSTNVKERLDFSCAIFDRAGQLVVNAPHIPVHLGAMGETVQAVIADNPDWSPGDVIVTNDPYRGGSHLPDVTVVTPIHDPTHGGLLFITASRAHHAEIGGIVPGSVPPFSRNLAEEGVLIRNFRLIHRGASQISELRKLLLSGPYPSRRVEDNLADVAAQIAANHLGAQLLLEMVDRHTFSQVHSCMRQIREAAAFKMRRALARHGDGVYSRTDWLDDRTPISVQITIADERATIDFTGTGPVLPGNLNANRAIVTAAVLYAFRCLINEDIPLNGGVLQPLTVVLPECLLNPPAAADATDCPAVVGGNVETSQRVVDVLLGALGLAAASQGTMNNLTFGDDHFGYYETICGGSGATPAADGADAVHTHMTNTRLTDVEVLEQRYPVRVQAFEIRRGSGGTGTHRGGAGVIRRLEFLARLHVSMLSQRRGTTVPFGLKGGIPGAAGENRLRRAGTQVSIDVGGAFQTTVQPGDVLEIHTPGGGGYGPTAARDQPMQRRDQ